MSDVLNQLMDGFAVALAPEALFYCFVGVTWGSIVGVLPGLGPLAGMSLLLPLTLGLNPELAIIMLAGIFYGAMYGGSATSILMRMPGEAASVITCLDGYEMARQGRAGPALVVAAVGSWIGGTISIVGLMFMAPLLAQVMLKVGPSAEVSLMLAALIVLGLVSSGSAIKTFTMIALGLILSLVGFDPMTAWPRFTFGILDFAEGLNFAAVAIGLFGISELLLSIEKIENFKPIIPKFRELIPRKKDLRDSAPAIFRGSIIGFVFGLVPGISHVLSTFVSYVVEKRVSKNPEEFGKGAIAGVAGPETANNATTGSAMIPLLILGIPAIPATAVLLTALMVHGVQPGPMMLTQHPEVFWGLIASMYIGNFMLLILNLPLVAFFVSLLRIPYGILAPLILLVSFIGVYGLNLNTSDLWLMLAFGLVGYVLRKFQFDVATLLIALVLGERIEKSFRQALTISNGDFGIFIQGPAAKILASALILLIVLQGGAWALGYRKAKASGV